MSPIQKIIHIDMDAFYASVEQRDRPELKGRPVIVGGDPQSRGVVSACSYEARLFGIHSAMPSSQAYKRCPQATFLKPRFEVYKAVSAEIRTIFHEYTDIVEPLSLDEAFLDVTTNRKGIPSATLIAQAILKAIYDRTGQLTASAGVSFNKFLAKVASDYQKPRGLTVITPSQAHYFIDRLPIRKFFGVGKVTERKMHRLGIMTGADLKKLNREKLIAAFGKAGNYFYDIANCNDNRPVRPHRKRKSIGSETTMPYDMTDKTMIIDVLKKIAAKLEKRLRQSGRQGITVTLKVKYFDFKRITRSMTVTEPLVDEKAIMKYIRLLLLDTKVGLKKVRLLGITVSNFENEYIKRTKYTQIPLPFGEISNLSGRMT
ncbi:DNA polymerase IV [Desulfococcaceae bacterium HSG9]|nr:DNA polymerase IV [Desulfococcaceae bacterium HSG9]